MSKKEYKFVVIPKCFFLPMGPEPAPPGLHTCLSPPTQMRGERASSWAGHPKRNLHPAFVATFLWRCRCGCACHRTGPDAGAVLLQLLLIHSADADYWSKKSRGPTCHAQIYKDKRTPTNRTLAKRCRPESGLFLDVATPL
jgi:hypothetical protein